jgi:hypothetical protein
MNNLVDEYIRVFKDVVLRAEDEEEYFRLLDELWDSMNNEQQQLTESRMNELKPSAPISLGLVDQPVKVGESIPPRIKSVR